MNPEQFNLWAKYLRKIWKVQEGVNDAARDQFANWPNESTASRLHLDLYETLQNGLSDVVEMEVSDEVCKSSAW